MTTKPSSVSEDERRVDAGARPGETREQFLKRVLDESEVEHRETLDRLAE